MPLERLSEESQESESNGHNTPLARINSESRTILLCNDSVYAQHSNRSRLSSNTDRNVQIPDGGVEYGIDLPIAALQRH